MDLSLFQFLFYLKLHPHQSPHSLDLSHMYLFLQNHSIHPHRYPHSSDLFQSPIPLYFLNHLHHYPLPHLLCHFDHYPTLSDLFATDQFLFYHLFHLHLYLLSMDLFLIFSLTHHLNHLYLYLFHLYN